MPIQHTCLPTSIFSPVEHTLFLGSSIASFDCTGEWGQGASQLSVMLVDDPCAGSKAYYDSSLIKKTWTAADPGFLGVSTYGGGPFPLIGIPCFFRVKNFEYQGILQSWEQMESLSGKPTYRVNLVSPTQILESAKLIINDYGGTVGSAPNLFNIYGMMEQFSGVPCSQTYLKTLGSGELPEPSGYLAGDAGVDGAIFGAESSGFGGSLVNANGMPWNRIKNALYILTGAYPAVSNNYSPYGRLLFYGTNYSGFGLCGYDRLEANGPFSGHSGYLSEYILDVSELPNPGDDFRLSGNNISVLDAINQVCDICSYDYYI